MRKSLTFVTLCILLIAGICLFAGCDTEQEPADTGEQTTASVTVTQPEAQETDTPEETTDASEETTAAPVETDPETNAPPTVSNPSGSTGGSALIAINTLEGICTPERVHNITTATYVGYEVKDDTFYLIFDLVKNHAGLDMTSQFKTIYHPWDDIDSLDPADIMFEEGVTYLLLLHRYRDVYHQDGDEFQVSDNSLLIEADHFDEAMIYGAPLEKHVTGMKITAQTTLDSFIAYLKEITKDHPDYTGKDYIHSDALADVMTQSPHVVTVTTTSVTSDMSIKTITLRCRVDAVHKGSLTVGEYIDIMFPLEENMELNQTFIITLNDPHGMNWYSYSCKKAIFPLSEADSILAIIKGEEQLAS